MTKKHITSLSILFLLSFCLIFLCACSEQSTPVEEDSAETALEEEQESALPANSAHPNSHNDVDLTEYAYKAISEAQEAIEFTPDSDALDKPSENGETDYYEMLFSQANDSLRAGNYREAELLYKDILKVAPTHFGANNNLALVYMHQTYNSASFDQALLTLALYPNEMGCLLNVQAAAGSQRYHPARVAECIDIIYSNLGHLSLEETLATEEGIGTGQYGEYVAAFRYNYLYAQMEFDMPLKSEKADAYVALHSELVGLELYMHGDPDAEALLQYLNTIAKLRGHDVIITN